MTCFYQLESESMEGQRIHHERKKKKMLGGYSKLCSAAWVFNIQTFFLSINRPIFCSGLYSTREGDFIPTSELNLRLQTF